jgi:hypothetical protein
MTGVTTTPLSQTGEPAHPGHPGLEDGCCPTTNGCQPPCAIEHAFPSLGAMLNLKDPHDVERVRRSLAMLRPEQMALKREEAIQLLDQLIMLQEGLKRTIEGCQALLTG